jgi:hypothetical protein
VSLIPLSNQVPIQLSILDAARRETRRLDRDQRARWLPLIEQAEYRVLSQSGQWLRYGLLTETQRQGGVAFFTADSWMRTVGTGKQDTVQISCHLIDAEHNWNPEALQDSLDEIAEVDAFSADCWRSWLENSLPSSLQSYQADLLGRLDTHP